MTKISKRFTTNGENFDAEITFDNEKQAADAGAKYVVWALQRQAREGKIKPGKVLKVDHEGNVYKSAQDVVEEMDAEQARATLEALQERFAPADKPAK